MGIWGSYCNIPKAIFYLLQGGNQTLTPYYVVMPQFGSPGEFLGTEFFAVTTLGAQLSPSADMCTSVMLV